MNFTFASDSIDNVVPLQHSKTILLSKRIVYGCEIKKNGDLKHRSILTAEHQIVLISSCRDVLAMLKDRKCINHTRVEVWSIATFVSAKLSYETYLCVRRTRKRASIYACVAHRCYVNLSFRDYKISVLDEFGRILNTFAMQLRNSPNYHRKFCNR